MILSQAEATEFLTAQGLAVPEFILLEWMDLTEEAEGCIESNPRAKTLMASLFALMALRFVSRQISSQSAPSGASQSYTYGNAADTWRYHLQVLKTYDEKGCLTAYIPPDADTGKGALIVGRGCNCV